MGLKNEGDCVPGVRAHCSGEGASQKLSTGGAGSPRPCWVTQTVLGHPDHGVFSLGPPEIKGRLERQGCLRELLLFKKLKYNCFTMLCQFLLYSDVNLPYAYAYIYPLPPLSHPPPPV